MVSIIYAGLLGLMLVFLSIRVIKARGAAKVMYGDGGDMILMQRCRAQANFTEYTPLFLLLLALAEIHQSPNYLIHGLGAAFIVGRIFHAYSMLTVEKIKEGGGVEGTIKFRVVGMMLTFFPLSLVSILLLWKIAKIKGLL